jgi:predicted small metal-binding protein
MLSIFWAFIAEYVDRLKSDTETYHKTKQISEDLKKDWQKIKSNLNIFRTNRRNND